MADKGETRIWMVDVDVDDVDVDGYIEWEFG